MSVKKKGNKKTNKKTHFLCKPGDQSTQAPIWTLFISDGLKPCCFFCVFVLKPIISEYHFIYFSNHIFFFKKSLTPKKKNMFSGVIGYIYIYPFLSYILQLFGIILCRKFYREVLLGATLAAQVALCSEVCFSIWDKEHSQQLSREVT